VQQQLDAAAPGAYVVGQAGAQLTIARTAGTAAVAVANAAGAGAGAWAAAAGVTGTPASAATQAGFDVDGHAVSLTGNYAGNPGGLVAAIQSQLDASAAGAYAVSGDASGLSIRRTRGDALPAVDHFTGIGASVFARNASAHLTLAAGDFSVQVGQGSAVDITGDFYSPDALAQAIQDRVAGVVSVHVDPADGKLRIDARQTITVGGAQGGSGGSLGFAPSVNPAAGSLDDADIGTQASAGAAVERIDAALDAITARRGFFGAMESRFGSIALAEDSDGALAQASRGRIVDADYASEAAALSRAGILQQAGAAMVAAANAQARTVLSLLQVT
jgi:flagellin